MQLAALLWQSDRNIRKLWTAIHKKLQKKLYINLRERQERGDGLMLRERPFMGEYDEAVAEQKGKDAVIRGENKTKPRK